MTLEYIRKLMGWCPNAKTLESRSSISPYNFETYARSGGEKAGNPRDLNRLSRLFSMFEVRILLPTLFFTLYLINLLSQKGVNIEAFLPGISLSLLTYLLGWKKQMHKYDALAKKPAFVSSFKKTFFRVFSVIILGLILLMVFLSYILSHAALFLNAQSLYSFIAGALPLMWGTYLQLIYWEKKNHMKIYIKNEKRFQKMYALEEKAGEQ